MIGGAIILYQLLSGLGLVSSRISQIQLAEALEWFIEVGQSNLCVYWYSAELRAHTCGTQKSNHANLR